MFLERLAIKDVKCFEDLTLDFTAGGQRAGWITLLGENGVGKSTLIRALALLLAGPDAARELLPRPTGWVRAEREFGTLEAEIHKEAGDPGEHGRLRQRQRFTLRYDITGERVVERHGNAYTQPTIVEASRSPALTWLKTHAFAPHPAGWFAAGYGAFRRLSQEHTLTVPGMPLPTRRGNFSTIFDETEPTSSFQQWLLHLDYQRRGAPNDPDIQHRMQQGIDAINSILPGDNRLDGVSPDGRLLFRVNGVLVPAPSLPDGYRSIVALVGDLIWRLLARQTTPEPLSMSCGVVLIDELDAHLHPTWQRTIAGLLQRSFPHLQFIVATHSPQIAVGAGPGAVTLRLLREEARVAVRQVTNLHAHNVDRALTSDAFSVESAFSPETERQLRRYHELLGRNTTRSPEEESEFTALQEFIHLARPYGGPPPPGSLEERVERFLSERLQ